MDHQARLRTAALAATALAAVVLATACSPLQGLRARMRDPGETNLELPEDVSAEYHCDKRPLPFFQVEKYEVIPARVKAGGTLAHRLVYVLCPRERTEVVSGLLTTRVRFKGRVIVKDAERYDLKPGRWRKDQAIQLPASAEPGVYSLDLAFDGDARSDGRSPSFEQQESFVVRATDD